MTLKRLIAHDIKTETEAFSKTVVGVKIPPSAHKVNLKGHEMIDKPKRLETTAPKCENPLYIVLIIILISSPTLDFNIHFGRLSKAC